MGEVAALDDVGPAVAVDVEGQVAEVVDVAVGVVDVAEVVLGPGGGLVPAVAGDDVELAVVIEVGEGCGFVVAGVDHGDFEGDVGGARGGEEGGRAEDEGDEGDKVPLAHAGGSWKSEWVRAPWILGV